MHFTNLKAIESTTAGSGTGSTHSPEKRCTHRSTSFFFSLNRKKFDVHAGLRERARFVFLETGCIILHAAVASQSSRLIYQLPRILSEEEEKMRIKVTGVELN